MTRIFLYPMYVYRLLLPSGGLKVDPETGQKRRQVLEVPDLFVAKLGPENKILINFWAT